jgi:hypothetical protein
LPPWLEWTTFGVVLLFMLVGLFGLLVPFFPGLVVMWLAALGYGLATQSFGALGIFLFVLITVIMIFGSFVDNLMMGVGARKGGAGWVTILVALVAGVGGTILFPPIGGIIAAPLAILLLEYFRLKDWKKAWKAFTGLTVGWGLSFLARFGLGVLVLLLWLLWVWKA